MKSHTRQKERWHWFSAQQKEAMAVHSQTLPIAKLDSGEEVIFTESTEIGASPSGKWRDYVFLGKGVWERSTVNDLYFHWS